MNYNIFDKIKKIILVLFFITIFLIFIVLLIKSSDSKLIKQVKDFIKNDTETKILYISNKENYSNYPMKLLNKYEVSYLYVDSTNLDNFEETKLEKIINSKYLSNIIVIYKNGKIVDAIIDYENQESLNVFFQTYDIIPKVISNVENIIENAQKALDKDLSILYLPYEYNDELDNQEELLNKISLEYNIPLQRINAYLLSFAQKEKLNQLLQISSVEDQILIFVRNKEIVGSLRGINSESEYLDALKKYLFVSEQKSNLKEINYENFLGIIKNKNKNVIVVIKNECKYCEEVLSTLNLIALEKNITINYINIDNFESDLSKKVESKLSSLGYNDGFTTPITILVESDKLLDYSIGNSSEKYFVDIFLENGIIIE